MLTEVAGEDSLLGTRGPLAIGDRSIRVDVETIFLVALGEVVVSALGRVYGVLPLPEEIVDVFDDAWSKAKVVILNNYAEIAPKERKTRTLSKL